MTDQQILTIIQRRMAFVEQELIVAEFATPAQFTKVMGVYAEEFAKELGRRLETDGLLPPQQASKGKP